MQLPIFIGLHRSFFLSLVLAATTVFAASLIFFVPWPRSLQVSLLASVLLFWWLATRRLFQPLFPMRLGQDGDLALGLPGDAECFVPVQLLPGATVHPYLVVVRVQHEQRVLPLVLTPFDAKQDDFRRLRVWLKWHATYGVSDGV